MKVESFKKDNNTGFEFYFEKNLKPNEVVYLKMPPISSNKRSINDIGWQCENETSIYATLAHAITNTDDTLWSKIENEQDINKTVQFLKIIAGTEGGKVYIRANLN